jgi:predicted type IV restriction endonuclease
MPKYVDAAKDRIRKGLRRFAPIIEKAKQAGLNEADTRTIIKTMLDELLGYDKFFDVTAEYSIKGQYADFAVKIEDQIRFFIEAKAVGVELDERHLFQVVGYAANHGHDWTVLTNGDQWRIYRLFSGPERRTELACAISLTDPDLPLKDKVDALFLLSKEGFKAKALEAYWAKVEALHPKRIAQVLMLPKVLTIIGREVRRKAKSRVSDEQVRDVLLNQVIRGSLADEVKDGEDQQRSRTVRQRSRGKTTTSAADDSGPAGSKE